MLNQCILTSSLQTKAYSSSKTIYSRDFLVVLSCCRGGETFGESLLKQMVGMKGLIKPFRLTRKLSQCQPCIMLISNRMLTRTEIRANTASTESLALSKKIMLSFTLIQELFLSSPGERQNIISQHCN